MERAGSPLRRRRRAPAAGEIMPVNLTAHRMPSGRPARRCKHAISPLGAAQVKVWSKMASQADKKWTETVCPGTVIDVASDGATGSQRSESCCVTTLYGCRG